MSEFNDELEKYIEKRKEWSKENYIKTNTIFHASEAGLCPRKIFLERTCPMDENEILYKMFEIGNIFHEFIQSKIFHGENERPLAYTIDNLKILGRADIVMPNEIIEIKTIKNVNYLFVPKEEHVIQLNIYLNVLEIPKGRIIYVNKNDFESKEFDIIKSKPLFDKTVKRIQYIANMLKKKADFKEIEASISPNCWYCKYVRHCFPKQKHL
jgi:CRISPR/Cas system-associated exonuclease Cas4 (RecB family)